jgi:hypothetical protein
MDAAGKPIEHATVMIYEAGVKKGYSIFCPTCYTDCGKHTLTDAEGNYRIGGLSPDLHFTLLVIRDGSLATWVRKVDPIKGPADNVVLKPRPPVQDLSQVVRGRVVDAHGKPVRDAVIEQQGVSYKREDGQIGTMFGGAMGWIDPLTVTNDQGEFEIAYGKPAVSMILQVRPRAMAPKLFTEATGADRKTLVVTDGATIRGRLVLDGKPVLAAEVGLATSSTSAGRTYPEVRIGTGQDGRFAITNIPAGRIWLLYPKMDSLAARNLAGPVVECETRDDGEMVDLGDIELAQAHVLRGRATLSDGKPIPPDMRVTIFADRGSDSQFAVLTPDGNFEFRGLRPGIYDLSPAVKGYHSAEGFRQVLVKRDVNGIVIQMQPGTGRP